MTHPADGNIILVPYDPVWATLFEEERARLEAAVGEWAADIQHVGSTSIPGIAAKPIIDIAVLMHDIADALYCITPLVEAGYECMGEFGIPGRIYFRRRTETPAPGQLHYGVGRTHHVHMFELDHEQYGKQIVFRDYLRTHPAAAREYEALKRGLAAKYAGDMENYALAKSDFVLRILAAARASGTTAEPGNTATAPRPSSHSAERGNPAQPGA